MCLAVPGRVLALTDGEAALRTARVDFAGIQRQVHLAFVPEARVGDYVLVHVGFAIAKIDQAEAQRVFDALRDLDALDDNDATVPQVTQNGRRRAGVVRPRRRDGARGLAR